jgi:menaquinone-dependent protoporphyrinogen IX oxidase
MKGIVIYDSSFGNTRAIAEAISETLKESGKESDILHVKKVKKLSPKDYDFLVLGSPTRFGTMSFTFKGFLNKLTGEEWTNKPFAAFDTELIENIERKEGSAAEKIAEKLKAEQMTQMLPVLKAVSGMKGPLQEGEIARAKDWAKELAAKLRN